MLLAAVAATAGDAVACTSWVIHPSVSRSGRMIVHKVLDQYRRDGRLKARMRVAPNGWRWMCIGFPNYAMNEKGVVMTTNDGDRIAQRHPDDGIRQAFGPATMNRMVMTGCSTAEQGVAKILEIGRNRLAVQGGIYFIADSAVDAPKLAGQIRTEVATRLGLIDESRFDLCFIVDFPMFERDEDGKIIFTHNPFSMPQGGLDALENQDPETILAYQYDIVCNGVELSSGAVRNHDIEIMKKAFDMAGYSEDDLKAKFSALYNAFQYGAPPHAGMAPGVDRMLMLLTGEENIREVIAFPMNSNAQDVLLGSPGEVTEQQLREVHIKLR